MKGSLAVLLAIGLALVATPTSAQHRGNRGGARADASPPMNPASGRGNQPPAVVVAPPMKTASEGYWDAVRAAGGPIGFPQPTSRDKFTRPSRPRPPSYGSAFYGGVPFVEPPEPVYVPVYVPGPVVYVPVPATEPPAAAPAENTAPPTPRRPEKFYIIPGCYAGNKPPQPTALPAGCDIQKLHVNTW